jgi:Family of unknown function (DUF6011)
MSDTAKFTTVAAARAFLLGGNATVTLVSTKTGTRFTYKIRANDEGDVFFVSLLSGPDNEADYRYLGRIDPFGCFWAGRRTPKPGDVSPDAPSSEAFDWAWSLVRNDVMPAMLEIWHEGRCARCNRKLTVPSSIESGFGPECAGKVGFSADWAGF